MIVHHVVVALFYGAALFGADLWLIVCPVVIGSLCPKVSESLDSGSHGRGEVPTCIGQDHDPEAHCVL